MSKARSNRRKPVALGEPPPSSSSAPQANRSLHTAQARQHPSLRQLRPASAPSSAEPVTPEPTTALRLLLSLRPLLVPAGPQASQRQDVRDNDDHQERDTEGDAAGLPRQTNKRTRQATSGELEEAQQRRARPRSAAGTVERERRQVANAHAQAGHVRQEEGDDAHQQRS